MKLTAFLGSPRAQGNTDILTARVLDGAQESGVETQTVALRNLKIHPCIGCEKCWKNDKPCVFNDDMIPLFDTIAGSDVILISTPVYWYAPTTLMKAFMDRWVPFNRPQGKPLIQGKGAILVVAYEEEGPVAAEPVLKTFELSFGYLGLKNMGQVVVDGVGPKGAVLEKPDALQRAYEIGLNLGRALQA